MKELLDSKLEVDVQPSDIVRIRFPDHDKQKTKILVRFNSHADKYATLANCRKLKNFPGIRIWEDLTLKQQANKKQQMPKLFQLRRDGKIAFSRAGKIFIKDQPSSSPRLADSVRSRNYYMNTH